MYDRRLQNRVHQNPITELKVWLRVNGKRVIHNVAAVIETDEHNADQIINSNEHWYMKEVTGSKKRVTFPVRIAREPFEHYVLEGDAVYFRTSEGFYRHRSRTPRLTIEDEKTALRALKEVASYYRSFTYYSASQFTDPSKCPIFIEIDDTIRATRLQRRLETHAKWLYDLYATQQNNEKSFNSFLSVVGSGGIGLIDSIEFNEIPVSSEDYRVRVGGRVVTQKRTKKMVIPQIRIGSSVLSPSQLSEGTFRTLAMLFYILSDSSGLLLIEEPEVCIHHGLLASVIEIIKERSEDKQIVISTHSDFILDHLATDSVYVVNRKHAGGTSIAGLNAFLGASDGNALRKFLDQEGTLGEYWKLGALDD